MNNYTSFGRLLACIDHALKLSPAAISNCLSAPKTYMMGLQLQRAMPIFRRHPGLDKRVAEIMDDIDLAALENVPDALPLVDQGVLQLAYYQERSKLPGLGSPATRSGVDWRAVDWSKTDAELSEEHGVSRQAVYGRRKRWMAS